MSDKYDIQKHKEWINYLQPEGLVFAPGALIEAEIRIPNSMKYEHDLFLEALDFRDIEGDKKLYYINNLKSFFSKYLNYSDDLLKSANEITFFLSEYNETLDADFCIEYQEKIELLIKEVEEGFDLDKKLAKVSNGWETSEHSRFERLMREKEIEVGVVSNKLEIRLIFAPRGETSGYITFPVKAMSEIAGRGIFYAFNELLHSNRLLFYKNESKDLNSILHKSRKFQNDVSVKLSDQVLAAMYELLRGFQAANDAAKGALFSEIIESKKNLIYEGLTTTLLRCVFVLFVEDRELSSNKKFYINNYSLRGLFNKLRSDHSKFSESMDRRYGAWSTLISLFRLYYEGVEYNDLYIPTRDGFLFDPKRFSFLESDFDGNVPLVNDLVIYNVLSSLIVVDGEIISYRTLDVEQIGSVYETLMGFEVGIAPGNSTSIKPKNATKNNVPSIINLDELLTFTTKAAKAKYFKSKTGVDLTSVEKNAVHTSENVLDLLDALSNKRYKLTIPTYVTKGSLIFYPSEERMRSGSHYTPRELTAPIVKKSLDTIFKKYQDIPKPEDILSLNICDPAMGSGAFLVEVCRQLGDKLIESWHCYSDPILSTIDPDEGEILYARRMIAQRCLYGVDRNYMAVDLAKLSLWLVTLSKEKSFTFLDHQLRWGDSIVGLKSDQITAFNLFSSSDLSFFQYFKEKLTEVLEARHEIQFDPSSHNYVSLEQILEEYSEKILPVKLIGHLLTSSFFEGRNKSSISRIVNDHELIISNLVASNDEKRIVNYCFENMSCLAENDVIPFHWEVEFPEVFKSSGFDLVIGNPPFLGGRRLSKEKGKKYLSWLNTFYPASQGSSDLCAYFFRRASEIVKENGCISFISTNSICEGVTRESGLHILLKNSFEIYKVNKNKPWPGKAGVTIDVVYVYKGSYPDKKFIDELEVKTISSFFEESQIEDVPKKLEANLNIAYQGVITLGMGFTFDDRNSNAIPLNKMNDVLAQNEKCSKYIFEYIGGDEVNSLAKPSCHRYAINFGEKELNELEDVPELVDLIRSYVKPGRDESGNADVRNWPWWRYWRTRSELYDKIHNMKNVLVTNCQASPHLIFTYLDTNYVFANSLDIFCLSDFKYFALLQSTVHEVWSRFFGTTLEERLRYNHTECFENFPFPETLDRLSSLGEQYFIQRQKYVEHSDIGLTKFYNMFFDENSIDKEIINLRNLHREIDKVVIESYKLDNRVLQYTHETIPRLSSKSRETLILELLEINKARN